MLILIHNPIDESLGIAADSMSLVLFSETSIRIYFNLSDGSTMNDYTFAVTDTAGQLVDYKINAESNYLEIPNIGATKLDELYTITAEKDGTQALSIRYGAFSYIYNKLSSSNENLVNVVKALYAYNKAAEEYAN